MYTMKFHSQKGESEDSQVDDQNILLKEGMTIKTLKSYILSIKNQAFFLKFHMGNNELLQDLIDRTRAWNTKRGINNDDGALVFDVYLDREFFDLHMEIDEEKEKEMPIGKGQLKYLTIKRLKGSTSLKQLFIRIQNELRRTYEIELDSSLAIGIKLENGDKIVNQKHNEELQNNTLNDHFVTRFSTIKFYGETKEATKGTKANLD